MAEEMGALQLEGLIGFTGSVVDATHVIRSTKLPGSREWLAYPLGALVVVRQTGGPPGAPGAVAFLRGHSHDVSCLCVSRDGTRLASGQDSQQGVPADVLVWDLREACEAALGGESNSERALLHRLRHSAASK